MELLKLDGCPKISDEGIIYLIKNCKKIRNLHLRRVLQITDKFLLEINEHMPNLRFLNLRNHGKNITKACIEEVVSGSDVHRFIIHDNVNHMTC